MLKWLAWILIGVSTALNIAGDNFAKWAHYDAVYNILHTMSRIAPAHSSWFNAWDVFDFTNTIALISFSAACWIITRSRAGAFCTILMASLLYDKLWGVQTHVQLNDIVFYAIAAASLIGTKKAGPYFWALIATGIFRIIIDNIHGDIFLNDSNRSIWEVGNAMTFLPMAFIYVRKTYKEHIIIPGMALVCTSNDFIDTVKYTNRNLTIDELQLIVLTFTLLLVIKIIQWLLTLWKLESGRSY